MNKKGNFIAIVYVVGALFLLIMVGIALAIGSATINWVFDKTIPELNTIGQVGDWNSSETVEIAIDPVNTLVQNFKWVSGVVYLFGLIGIFGLAYSFRFTGDRWLMGFFFLVVLILVIGSIFMSNIYEEIYNDGSELGEILQEHTILSFMIIYSPAIMSLIAFLAGILMFSGPVEVLR